MIVWRVRDGFDVELLHSGEVWFDFPGDDPVVLDGSETWRLVRALVSTRVGARELEAAALQAIVEMAPVTAAGSGKDGE